MLEDYTKEIKEIAVQLLPMVINYNCSDYKVEMGYNSDNSLTFHVYPEGDNGCIGIIFYNHYEPTPRYNLVKAFIDGNITYQELNDLYKELD
jgi:hypothetical protein